MEVRAVGKYVKVQPRKVRIIADEVRGRSATRADALLKYHPSKSARALRKVLVSAMANAAENHQISPDNLRIATIMIDEGPRQKRMRARAMGRGYRILKKTSHITVVVEEYEGPVQVKPHGTKPKPRPTFAAPKKGGKKKSADPVEEVVEAQAEAPAEPEVEVVEAEAAAIEETAVAESEPVTAQEAETEAEVVEETPAAEAEAGAEEQEAEAEGASPEEEKGAE